MGLWLNVSMTKRGGMTFLKLGRINISWSVSKSLEKPAKAPRNRRYTARQVDQAYDQGFRRGTLLASR